MEANCVDDMVDNIGKERRQIDSKARDIHHRAAEMVKDGHKHMSAKISKMIDSIEDQVTVNKVAVKEMMRNISQMQAHIRGFEREMAHFTNVFYHGEAKKG